MNDEKVKEFWIDFLARHSYLPKDLPLDSWSFGGDDPDELAHLVLAGTKTATSSLLSVYASGGIRLPLAGDYSVLLNASGEPLCVIHLKETKILKFHDVDAQHAWEEGEGDRTLEHWRKVHRKFFSKYPDFSEESEILRERFEVIS